MPDRDTMIAKIADGLMLDDAQRTVSRDSLRAAGAEFVTKLHGDVLHILEDLDGFRDRLAEKNAEYAEKIRKMVDTDARKDQARFERLLTWTWLQLQWETGPILTLVSLLKERHAHLRDAVLDDRRLISEYVRLSITMSNVASEQIGERPDLDERIALAELLVDGMVGINHVDEHHKVDDTFRRNVFNCVRACRQIDALSGFDRNVDRFSGTAIAELRRLAPTVLSQVSEAETAADQLREDGKFREAVDCLLNYADFLSIWVSVTKATGVDYDPCAVYDTCFQLYDGALARTAEYPARTQLTVIRYAGARYRFVRFLFESDGIARKDEILANIIKASELLARMTNPDGDCFKPDYNLARAKLLELRFAALGIEVVPDIRNIRDYITSAVFELAETEDERLRTITPWLTLYRIYAVIDDARDEGRARLSTFIEKAKSPFARERAQRTLAYLCAADHRPARQASDMDDDIGWLEQIRSRPFAIASLKAALHGYERDGYGPKGSRQPLVLDAEVPDQSYAGIFRCLAEYDAAARRREADEPSGDTLPELELLLSQFADLDGHEFSASVEEISRFLFERGKKRLFYGDIRASVGLLQLGIGTKDDAFWYGRLVSAYRHLQEMDKAANVGAAARWKFPNDSVIAVECALVEVSLGRYADAATAISDFVGKVGVELSSCHPAVHGLLAYAMSMSDQGNQAQALYRNIVASRPSDWRARHGLASLLYRQGPEHYDEALRNWTSTILVCDPAGDGVQAWTMDDCFISIAQTLKEMRRRDGGRSQRTVDALSEIGDRLPTASLVSLMKSLTACGGLGGDVLSVMPQVAGRKNTRLARAFSQCCTSMLIEDTLKRTDTDYAGVVIEFGRLHGTMGDLFGGAKGAYLRNLLRISANPLLEGKLNERLRSLAERPMSKEWRTVTDIVATMGYSEDYYDKVYAALHAVPEALDDEIVRMLDEIIVRTTGIFRNNADRRKILLDDPFPRSFSVDLEDPISDGLESGIYNCDPDTLRMVLQHFDCADPVKYGGETSWTSGYGFSEEIQHDLLRANIRTESLGTGASKVSISSASAMYA